MADEWDDETAGPAEPTPHKSDLGSVDDAMAAGVPAAKFEAVGTVVRGVIVDAVVSQQRDLATGKPKFWEDGNPCTQILITLQTEDRNADIEDDDGKRRLYVKRPGAMLKAISTALGHTKLSQANGGTLAVKFTGLGEASQKGFNKPKLFAAKFTPAGGAAAAPTHTAPQSSMTPESKAKDAAWNKFKSKFPPACTIADLRAPWLALVARVSGGKAHPDIDAACWNAIAQAATQEYDPAQEASPAIPDDETIPF